MAHLVWLVPLALGLASLHWPKLQGIALLTMIVGGVVGVTLLVRRGSRTGQSVPPLGAEEKRDYYAVQRDIPPPPG